MSLVGAVDDSGDIVLRLRVRGPLGAFEVRSIVDTGFNGAVSLDRESIQTLGLRARAEVRYRLADGTYAESRVFDAEMERFGSWKRVAAVEARGGCLVGMQALYGHRLVVEAVSGGLVEISAL